MSPSNIKQAGAAADSVLDSLSGLDPDVVTAALAIALGAQARLAGQHLPQVHELLDRAYSHTGKLVGS